MRRRFMRMRGGSKAVVIFIVGPTAIGKTRLSIKLAKLINGEIISSDSMQVYKGMPILSQPPNAAQRRGVPHHLVNILDPGKEYSAAEFIKLATKKIDLILKRKRVPIVVGGSGMYLRTLVDGLFPSPKADLKFRKRMERFADSHGTKKLYKKLVKIDPPAAALIHQNDKRRIIRALEIFHSTGRTMTELKSRTKGIADLYDIKIFALTAPRQKIYSNIDRRVRQMFDAGAVKEVAGLNKRSLSRTAGAVLGIKEITPHLKGEYDSDTAMELVAKNTRRFAKRQLTWFRADSRIRWFDVTRIPEKRILNKIAKEAK